ncbi:flagellar hook protein FlgE [Noviherbaspirillum cavernae]|uniref:Flagellar hook protein FlgE n=1 Tax=Noviherbaspirillum cavernae TaxID=2320862 RepID=A0A418X0B2_9BURK|nr:flagellar hook protein FlgE [Noviherbaspirillum cavernae]RJG05937.1 flagellar hook protein FlgE [Noviherbaspirillum cavernae]
MAFQQGLSGLNAASKSLEVIGNNVSNAGTVGFKQAQAQFADVYANSLAGGGGSQVGIGTKLVRVAQQFTQGNISGTNNPLDIAINGKGFFRMNNAGDITYSRNGQFILNKDGFIENASGALLTGYPVGPNGVVSAGAPIPLEINAADLSPTPTGTYDLVLNLDSRVTAIPVATAFDPNNPGTYHKSVPVPVYDSLGNSHLLQTYYVNRGPVPGPGNSWDVYGQVTLSDGTTQMLGGAAVPPYATIGTLAFSNAGVMTPAAPLVVNFTPPGAAAMAINVSHASTTQFGSAMSVNSQAQNGYTSGSLTGFSVAADGKFIGRYSNGKANVLGQLALVNFANPNGLQAMGDNAFTETSLSGVPLIGTPGSSGMGAVQSSAVEESNVDLTEELVNMITAQRIYQANAQTIKTEDQIMQTLVNLR